MILNLLSDGKINKDEIRDLIAEFDKSEEHNSEKYKFFPTCYSSNSVYYYILLAIIPIIGLVYTYLSFFKTLFRDTKTFNYSANVPGFIILAICIISLIYIGYNFFTKLNIRNYDTGLIVSNNYLIYLSYKGFSKHVNIILQNKIKKVKLHKFPLEEKQGDRRFFKELQIEYKSGVLKVNENEFDENLDLSKVENYLNNWK